VAELMTKSELLQAIREQRANVDRVVAETGDRMNEPGAMGDWTMKDVIAHLTGWRQRSVARMEAAVAQREPVLPWGVPEGADDYDYEAINQRIHAANSIRTVEEVLAESRASFDQLEAAVAALSDDDLFSPSRFGWMRGAALGPSVIGGTVEHFHDEHEADIRAFLQS
jgi:hypothetical protein